mmetsp:Transcript_10766/g.23738  ORF Transcript_10766/g.23738 Transcript_10766/m.23738 type:complete len:307 (-) Transcript_10766:3156-4076(-)
MDVLRADRHPQHDLRGNLDEVHVERLGNEGESSGRPQVALDDLDLIVFAEELDVERPRNLQCVAQLLSNLLNTPVSLHKQGLRRQQQRRVSTVHPCVLDVLADGIVYHVTIAGHSIKLNLLCARHIFADNHWEILADDSGMQKEILHLLLASNHPHCSARKHVGRPHQHWEMNLAAEALRLLQRGELRPPRLIHSQGVTELAEPQAVLAGVDLVHGGTHDTAASSVQPHRQVVGHLSTDRDDDAIRILEVIDILDNLFGQLLKVQAVGLIVVSGHRLGIAVDDDSFATKVAHGSDRGHAAPIELHG